MAARVQRRAAHGGVGSKRGGDPCGHGLSADEILARTRGNLSVLAAMAYRRTLPMAVSERLIEMAVIVTCIICGLILEAVDFEEWCPEEDSNLHTLQY